MWETDCVAAVQIKDLLANCAKGEEEECKKYEDLRDVWLLGSAQLVEQLWGRR